MLHNLIFIIFCLKDCKYITAQIFFFCNLYNFNKQKKLSYFYFYFLELIKILKFPLKLIQEQRHNDDITWTQKIKGIFVYSYTKNYFILEMNIWDIISKKNIWNKMSRSASSVHPSRGVQLENAFKYGYQQC